MLKFVAYGHSFALEAKDRVRALARREEGQTMAEYAVVLAVVTLVVVGAIALLSDDVRDKITSVADIVSGREEPEAPAAG